MSYVLQARLRPVLPPSSMHHHNRAVHYSPSELGAPIWRVLNSDMAARAGAAGAAAAGDEAAGAAEVR
jgi:hypothetical protein